MDYGLIKFILLQQIIIVITIAIFEVLTGEKMFVSLWGVIGIDLLFFIFFNTLFIIFQLLKKRLKLRNKKIINYFILVVFSYVLTYLFFASTTTYPKAWSLGYFIDLFYFAYDTYVPVIIFMVLSEFLFNKIFNNNQV